jgi:deazaflavin-dependent oxidoreductase (nitroreductase family)
MAKTDESKLPKKSDIGTDISLFGEAHIKLYQETGGKEGYLWNGVPTLLLTTKGRKSGEMRTIPIIYVKVGEAYVIIGSQGGAPKHPLWYLNILADPHVKLQVKDEKFDAVARAADSPERERLWAEATRQWPNYDVYQTRTTRKIPVVVIERAKG